MKLNELVKNTKVTAYGFKALVEYACEYENKEGEHPIVVSSLSPAVMMEKGISQYYAPVLPRGTVFNTAQNVYDADLEVNLITVLKTPSGHLYNKKLIVSRHAGTIEILKEMYPDAEVLSGNVTPEDIEGAFVVGTLPPLLIQWAKSYQAVTIEDFDYSKDGDLSGEELQNRLHVSDPIHVGVGIV